MSADRYAVVGNPITHSRSPEIHAAFARQTGESIVYERLCAPLDGFVQTVEQFAREGGKGLNVTAPFKVEAFVLALEHSDRARQAAACNTLVRRGDHWFGDNTDGVGLVRDLTANLGVVLQGSDILVLGAGGAARGIVGPLLDQSPGRIVISNRTQTRAEELTRSFGNQPLLQAIAPPDLEGARFGVVVNATSAGASSEGERDDRLLPWPASVFAPYALAYDLRYADQPTPFMRWAETHGAARTVDGFGMLIEQAAESFFLWRGVRPATAPVFPLLRAKDDSRKARGRGDGAASGGR